jgi:Domain of unknown function (DUF4184)
LPFTLAHIAAILPAHKLVKNQKYFVALAIGSIVPDMEYFLRLNPASGFSHTIKGIFLFDIPVALLMIWTWDLYIKQSVIKFLPFIKNRGLQENKSAFPVYVQWLFIAWYTFLGILTHIIWDSFTHGKGFFVQRLDFLNQEYLIGIFRMKGCYLLWYISSFAGTLIVMHYFFKRSFNTVKNAIQRKQRMDFWSKTIFLTLMIAVIRISMGLSHNVPRHLVIIVIGAFIYAYFILAFIETVEDV